MIQYSVFPPAANAISKSRTHRCQIPSLPHNDHRSMELNQRRVSCYRPTVNRPHRIHLQTPVRSKQSLPLLPRSGCFLLHLRRLQNVLPFGQETAPGRGPAPSARARSSSPADSEHIPSWPRDHPPVPSQASPGAQSELIKKPEPLGSRNQPDATGIAAS